MKKVFWPGSSMMVPAPPALVSCGTMEKPNAITIAWTGIINSQPPKTYISVRPERYSYELIKNSGEFIINMPTENIVKAIDYCGCRSGAKEDKFKAMGLTACEFPGMSCPAIEQAKISVACKVSDILELGSHHMFLADIVGVSVNEDLIDEKGRLQIEKAGVIAYVHGQYFKLGESIGGFGYTVKKKSKKK